jgi:hypothetical protein
MGGDNVGAELAVRLRTAAKSLAGPQMGKVLTDLGVQAKKDAAKQVNIDIGGDTFSGWPKAVLRTEFKMVGDNEIEFGPLGRATGPFRVAEQGRHHGQSGPMQGPTMVRLTKSGKVAKRQAGRKRWNGSTAGFHTWTRVVASVTEETPKRAFDAVHKVLKEGLGL